MKPWIFINLGMFLVYLYICSVKIEDDIISEALLILDKRFYKFPEYTFYFLIYFISVPCGAISIILISFKIYTHDFIKSIQKSYLNLFFLYITSVLYILVINELFVCYIYDFDELETSDPYDIKKYVQVFTNVISLCFNIIVLVFLILCFETYYAFSLNSIPLSNLGLLKKNKYCLIFSLSVTLYYAFYLIRFVRSLMKYFNSLEPLIRIFCIAIFSVSSTSLIFCYFYYKSTVQMINRYSRVYNNISVVL